MVKKRFSILLFIALISASLSCYSHSTKYVPLIPLTIYRPSNKGDMDIIRCWIRIEDMDGNDVTYSCCRASYAWYDEPNLKHNYEKTYYLSGGMAMHLNLKKGKYRISFYTPVEKLEGLTEMNKKEWVSNVFEYDTENPCNVIFVTPTADENGFYTGGWHVDYKAPQYWIWTKPYRQ